MTRLFSLGSRARCDVAQAAVRTLTVASLLLGACTENPIAPTLDEGPIASGSTGQLIVEARGLPAGTQSQARIQGPEGYQRQVISGDTLRGLTPGAYTITADPATVGGTSVSPETSVQTVLVDGSLIPQHIIISFDAVPRRAMVIVDVGGLPTGVSANLRLSGPSNSTQTITRTDTVSNAVAGEWTLDALPVTVGVTTYVPTPATQSRSVRGRDVVKLSARYEVSTASIALAIVGLPAGVSGNVTVTGPDAFSRALTGTATLTGLASGTYAILATPVTVNGVIYNPTPTSSVIQVQPSAVATGVTISYAATAAAPTGTLALTVSGLPGGTPAQITVTGPNNYSRSVSATTSISSLTPGAYTVSAFRVRTSTGAYAGLPATQVITVIAGQSQTGTVAYTALPAVVELPITGLPNGVAATVTLTDPAGASTTHTQSAVIGNAATGRWRAAAASVVSGGFTYAPTPAGHDQTVLAGDTLRFPIAYSLSTGALAVTVAGLPAGSSAAVTVTGPNSYSQSLTATTTLTSLTPGTYTVSAAPVTSGGLTYQASPATRSVEVGASMVAEPASVVYASQTGSLSVTVSGLPSGTNPDLLLTGPNGYSEPITAAGTISSLPPGAYTLNVRPVHSVSAGTFGSSAPTHAVTITANATATKAVSYAALPAVVMVPVTGVPGGAAAAITLTAPSGSTSSVTTTTTNSNAATGRWRLSAATITSGGQSYAPSPASYDQTVLAGDTLHFPVAYGIATGGIAVTVSGLPAGTNGSVTVTGPNGYTRSLTSTQTLTGLTPGSYTVTAASVTAGGTSYAPSPATRSINVTASIVAQAASVNYTSQAGSLSLAVTGLPAGAAADLVLTGPNNFSQDFSASGTVNGIPAGSYTLAVRSVRTAAGTYAATPATRSVTITAGGTASQTVTYAALPAVVTVPVSGVPGGAAASITLTSPSGSSSSVTSSTTLSPAATGRWRLSAAAITSGGNSYAPSPSSYDQALLAGDTLELPVTYALASGAIATTVSGLPNGVNANITITGPNSYSRTLTGTQTITGLTPGSYTVTAASVTSGGVSYTASPATRTLTVTASLVAQAAAVSYASQAGSFSLTVSGLPAGALGDMTLTGPNSYTRDLTTTTTVTGLPVGSYTLSVSSVRTVSGTFAATPSTRSVAITAGGTASQTVAYTALPAVVTVPVSGVPSGASAAITLTSPSGSTSSVTSTSTLSPAATGRWRLSASAISSGGQSYAPTPTSYDQSALAGDTLKFPVTYALATGGIAVSVSGLPAGSNASVTITGPNSYSKAVTGTQTITGLVPGSYTVTAAAVSAGGTTYAPTPTTRSVTVTASLVAQAAVVSYAAQGGGGGGGGGSTPNLSVENVYVTQATQNWAGTASIVVGREALARVFVKAAASNTARPDVRLRVYANSGLVSTINIPASASSVPTAISEGTMSASWNVVIPASDVRMGMQVVADLDPGNTLGESDRSDNVWPRGGSLQNVTTIDPPTLQLRFVPVTIAGQTGNVSNGNMANWLTMMEQIYPIRDIDASVRAPFTSNAPALQSNDGNGAWSTVLSEINALRAADQASSKTHYYGVVKTSYGSGIAGLGYQPGRAAIGWDQGSTYQRIFAHEIGHNFALAHAPCGVGGGGSYPYSGGQIGVWGWNAVSNSLVSPTTTDVMGYCSTQWVSDWTWEQVAARRAYTGGMVTSAARTDGVLLWGRSDANGTVLEPAFSVVAQPTPEAANANFVADLYDEMGGLIASHRIASDEVDHDAGQQQFAVVVPLAPAQQQRVSRIVLRSLRSPLPAAVVRSALTQTAAFRSDSAASVVALAPQVRLESVAGGRRRANWNNQAYRMGMVRDRNTGEILSFLRKPGDEFRTDGRAVEVVFSDGARSIVERD